MNNNKFNNNESKSERLLFSMSHDIRTIMNSIVGFAEQAKKVSDDKEKLDACLDNVESCSKNLLEIINGVLDLTKIRSGNFSFDEDKYNLPDCVKTLISYFEEEMKARGIEYSFDYSLVEHQNVYMDKSQMGHALSNIIGFIIKLVSDNQTIKFTLHEDGINDAFKCNYNLILYIKKEIESKEELNKLTNISLCNENIEKNLPLAISTEIIDLVGGRVRWTSNENDGTVIDIYIPFVATRDFNEFKARSHKDSDIELLKGKRALIVDDNDLNREILNDILTEYGLEVTELNDGIFVYDELAKHMANYYDFILMDYEMPIQDGYTTARRIREDLKYKNLPLIAITANVSKESKMKAIDAGMDEYISKPIKTDKLINMLVGILLR